MSGTGDVSELSQAKDSRVEPRPLTEDEKWGRPMRDDWHGSVRARIHCQVGGRSNPFACAAPASWLVGRKKLCTLHAVGRSRRASGASSASGSVGGGRGV